MNHFLVRSFRVSQSISSTVIFNEVKSTLDHSAKSFWVLQKANCSTQSNDDGIQHHLKANETKLETYSNYRPCPISLSHLLSFGKTATHQKSFQFLRNEIPIRLANITKELELVPTILADTKGYQKVKSNYLQSFSDVIQFESLLEKDQNVLDYFDKILFKIRQRHLDTVVHMSGAVMEVRTKCSSGHNFQSSSSPEKYYEEQFGSSIQYFLDRLYTSRISIRMLINQHLKLFNQAVAHDCTATGILDPKCNIVTLINEAYSDAKEICQKHYDQNMIPSIEITSYLKGKQAIILNADTNCDHVIEFVYIPSHLYHIVFELLKNAMKATIENSTTQNIALTPIKVLICKGLEDITLQVGDQGGGIARSVMKNIFDYDFTTANEKRTEALEHNINAAGGGKIDITNEKMADPRKATIPLAGLGYGLPLSRLYARYFAGDLEVHSVEGWGTNAIVYLHALEQNAHERIPVFHKKRCKRMYKEYPFVAKHLRNAWTPLPDKDNVK